MSSPTHALQSQPPDCMQLEKMGDFSGRNIHTAKPGTGGRPATSGRPLASAQVSPQQAGPAAEDLLGAPLEACCARASLEHELVPAAHLATARGRLLCQRDWIPAQLGRVRVSELAVCSAVKCWPGWQRGQRDRGAGTRLHHHRQAAGSAAGGPSEPLLCYVAPKSALAHSE